MMNESRLFCKNVFFGPLFACFEAVDCGTAAGEGGAPGVALVVVDGESVELVGTGVVAGSSPWGV